MSGTDVIVQAKFPRPRGWIPEWNPQASTQALVDDAKAVLEEYAEHLPLTVRQIYYRLGAKGRIGKTEADYKRLGEVLQKARRARLIDFEDIRDDGITLTTVHGYASAAEVELTIRYIIASAPFHPDTGQPMHQIAVVEAAGMVPQVQRVAGHYGVRVTSSGGFNSVTSKRDLARTINTDGRPAVVWHIGDHDPSGVHVYQNLAEDVAAFADGCEITFRRLAVTPEQIAKHGLPAAPAKGTDRRTFDGAGTVQAEALPPDELARIVDYALASVFDHAVLDAAKASFDAAMVGLRERLGGGGI